LQFVLRKCYTLYWHGMIDGMEVDRMEKVGGVWHFVMRKCYITYDIA